LSTLTDTDLLDQTNKNSITQKQESIDNLKLSIDKKKNDLADLQISYDKTISDYDIKIEQAQNSLDILNKTLEVNNKSNEELNA
jgi:septal ring factor EnvC (AmiA/AmiB activator)